jgi:RNA polymerase sigma-70 factor, ECF subfamily
MNPDDWLYLSHCLCLAQAGDKKAYHAFLSGIERPLTTFLKRRIPLSDVDDVYQEILVSVHRARHTFDGKRPLLPWLMAIARYRIMDFLRGHYGSVLTDHTLLEDFQDIITEPVTNRDIRHEYIEEGVKQLGLREQRILKMLHEDGFTMKEVANQMDIKESTVKVAMHRAYKRIKQGLTG